MTQFSTFWELINQTPLCLYRLKDRPNFNLFAIFYSIICINSLFNFSSIMIINFNKYMLAIY